MVFIRPALGSDPHPMLRGERVYLRPPVASDYDQWAALRAASRAHLTPFEPQWAGDELSRSSFRLRLKRYHQDARNDLGYAFFILDASAHVLVGGITLSVVRRGISQAAYAGYWTGQAFTGRGHATEALELVVAYAFGGLGLHRVEAVCMPRNLASMRVLEKVGFQREGLARRCLKINGTWEDHALLALVVEDREH